MSHYRTNPDSASAHPSNSTGQLILGLILLLMILGGSWGIWNWARASGLALAPTATQTPTPRSTPTPTADFRATVQFQDRLTREAFQAAALGQITATPLPTETSTPTATGTATETPDPETVQLPTLTATPSPSSPNNDGATATVTDPAQPTATEVATETAVPTEAPTETPTNLPTETPIPTDTATATPSGPPTPPLYVVASLKGVITQDGVLKRGPNQLYPTIEPVLNLGQQVELRGRDRFGEWIYLCCSNDQSGWVRQAFVSAQNNTLPSGAPVTVTPDDIALLPIQAADPVLAATPTPTPLSSNVFPQALRDRTNQAFVPALPRPPFTFTLRDQATTGSATLGDVVVSMNGMFIASADARIYSFEPQFGSQHWRQDVGGLATYGLLVQDNRIYAAMAQNGGGLVVTLQDRGFDGVRLWSHNVPLPPVAPLALAGDRLFVTVQSEADQGIYTLNPLTGDEIWSYTLPASAAGRTLYKPAVGNQLLYVGGDQIRALDIVSGTLIWESSNLPGISTSPIFSAPGLAKLSELFVADGNNRALLLDANTGAQQWQFAAAGPITGMALNDTTLFVGGQSFLQGLNRETGVLLWQTSLNALVIGNPIVSPDLVVVATESGQIQVLDARNGLFLAAGQLQVTVTGGPTASRGWVYVPTANQSIYALSSLDQ